MPAGARRKLTGTLRRTRLGYMLEVDDGSLWQLDVSLEWNAQGRVDCRVTVEGVRSGSYLLDVHRLYIA